MKLLTYDEWIALNPEAKTPCESCKGTGKRKSDNIKLEGMFFPCEDCGGDGHYGRDKYREQLEKDSKLVKFAQEHGLIKAKG